MRFARRGAILVAVVVAVGVVSPAAAAPTKFGNIASVMLSEVSCHDEWVELANTNSKLPVQLAGARVAEDPRDPAAKRFTFAKTAVIKAGARALVKSTVLPFKIACGDERIYLLSSSGKILDRTQPPNLADGFSWSRFGSEWQAGIPTPALSNAAAPEGSVVDRAAWIFQSLEESTVLISVDPRDLQRLVDTPTEYVPAFFQMKDPTGALVPSAGPLRVGLRVKGNYGSRLSPAYGPNGLTALADKVSLKIKFNEYVKGQRFYGLKKLTLNNMAQDFTMTHETLAYQIARETGVIAPRTGYANVYVNGSLRGLYLTLEPYDAISLAWHIRDLQHLYEGWASTPDHFEVDEGSTTDRSDALRLYSEIALRNTFTTTASKLLNVERVAKAMAVEKFLNHWDGYSGNQLQSPNNFFLASDGKGVFQLLVWGMDATWEYQIQPGNDDQGGEPLGLSKGPLFQPCLGDDFCAAVYKRTLAELAVLMPTYRKLAMQLWDVHEPSRIADIVRPATEVQAYTARDGIMNFIAGRPMNVADFLVGRTTGAVRWVPTATRLTKGTAFSVAHFNAYSDVPGTFVYSETLWSKPPLGKRQVTVTFTPTDTSQAPTTKTIEFTVA